MQDAGSVRDDVATTAARERDEPQTSRLLRAADGAAWVLALGGLWLFLLGDATPGVVCVWLASYGYLWLGLRSALARLAAGPPRRPHAAATQALRSVLARWAAASRARAADRARSSPPRETAAVATAPPPGPEPASSPPRVARAKTAPARAEPAAAGAGGEPAPTDALEREILGYFDRSDLARQAYRYHCAIVSSVPIAALLGHWHRGLAVAALFVSLLSIVSSFVYRHGAIVASGLGPRRLRWRCHFLIAFGFYFSTTALKPVPGSVVTDALGSAILALFPALITSTIVRRLRPRRLPERLARWPIAVALAIYLLGLL